MWLLQTTTTQIGVTQVFPSIRRHLITDFSSREDYINAVLTSAHIPLYMDGALTSTFRGMPCVDGGLGNLVPKVPGCRYTVQISCIPHLNVVPGWSNIANSVSAAVAPATRSVCGSIANRVAVCDSILNHATAQIEPQASPPCGSPSAFNGRCPIEPSIETLSRHTADGAREL